MLHFASFMQTENTMQSDNLHRWVEEQMMRGRYIFTKKDVTSAELSYTDGGLNSALHRLVKKGMIVSPWQNFYVAVPMEYRLKGEVPPSFYIDHLMGFLNRDYYVSLLSAAALHGAGHQRAMVFQVTANGPALRSGFKNGTRLDFTLRQQLPVAYTDKIKVQTGYINVASAELTALDMVSQEEKIGGLSRVAEVLVELAERMHWDETKLNLLDYFSSATIQRLGYLLDLIEENALSDGLMNLAKRTDKIFRKVRLKQSKPAVDNMPFDPKWKIIVNQEIYIDNI